MQWTSLNFACIFNKNYSNFPYKASSWYILIRYWLITMVYYCISRYVPYSFECKYLMYFKKSMRVFRNEHFVSDLIYPGEQHLMYYIVYIRVCQMCQSFKKSWLSFIFPLLDLNGWQKHQYYQIIWILEGGSTTPKFIVYSMKGESEQIGSSLKNHRRSNAINFNLTYVWGVLYQSPLMC